ncbi:beta/gamma crystallin family protein [Nostoc sp. CHAB 5784]|uniref:beta/gamma crystallin-related protein n=1 Tax=Nostoc mirabile TaxID=2907820 RepID=UPI001E4F0F64|nr:beta/gamma crystallin-related protein [Nostoc mirabile]MCC5663615.1 beta/gamma crystallin family protein [Nostoc mirabile CHAB5784]
MLNPKEYFKQLDATLTVMELDDEVAATCSGGAAPVSLYEDINYGGAVNNIYGNDDNLDNALRGSGWNNRTSSIVIREGTWTIFEDSGYKGRSKVLGPGRYPNPEAFGLRNDSLTAIRRL